MSKRTTQPLFQEVWRPGYWAREAKMPGKKLAVVICLISCYILHDIFSSKMSSSRSLWPTLLLLGDSLTQYSFSKDGRWGALLANSLTRQCDVLARGFSGYNSRQWVTISKQLKGSLNGDIATLWLGANDASQSDQQGVPIEEYKTNLATIVDNLKSHGIKEVILLTPPPANENAMNPDTKIGRSGALTAKYAEACLQVAEAQGLTVVDLHSAFKIHSDWHSLLSDGLHLSGKGSELVHSLLLPIVREKLRTHQCRGMATEELILPPYREAANANPSPQIENWINEHPRS